MPYSHLLLCFALVSSYAWTYTSAQDETSTFSATLTPEECPENEEISHCGPPCGGTCDDLGKGPIFCPLQNCSLPGFCVCKPTFYRNEEGNCVTASECPNPCKCDETLDTCGGLCQATCENALGVPLICPDICSLYPACVCKPGLYRLFQNPGGPFASQQWPCVPKTTCQKIDTCFPILPTATTEETTTEGTTTEV